MAIGVLITKHVDLPSFCPDPSRQNLRPGEVASTTSPPCATNGRDKKGENTTTSFLSDRSQLGLTSRRG